jgi:hypothetical protein
MKYFWELKNADFLGFLYGKSMSDMDLTRPIYIGDHGSPPRFLSETHYPGLGTYKDAWASRTLMIAALSAPPEVLHHVK